MDAILIFFVILSRSRAWRHRPSSTASDSRDEVQRHRADHASRPTDNYTLRS